MAIIKFEPLLIQKLWGGNKIISFKHLNITAENVGESWEISAVKGYESVVSEGPWKGRSLSELVLEMKQDLVGKENFERFGEEFPLLVKFIDARQDLSIQVHPTDEIARRQGKPHGKTEMWYIMESAPGAKLYCGLEKQITSEEYKTMIQDDSICDALAQYEVKEGDVFFLPAGRIHSVGSGCFLAEIQQTSDLTYRIYDFKRRDKDGNYRELHTKEAAECINFKVENDYRTHYVERKNQGVMLVQCPYFSTAVYDLDEPMTLDYSELDSFVILMFLKGEGSIVDNEGNKVGVKTGDTLLIPATTETISVSGTVKYLEIYC